MLLKHRYLWFSKKSLLMFQSLEHTQDVAETSRIKRVEEFRVQTIHETIPKKRIALGKYLLHVENMSD